MQTVPTEPPSSSRTYDRIHRTWSDISSSPTLLERPAASWSSSGDRQPLLRRITYVFIQPPRVGATDPMTPDAAPQGVFLARPPEVGHGIRLAVKDLFDTAGLTTTYGSIVYADHVPAQSAEVVRRLE